MALTLTAHAGLLVRSPSSPGTSSSMRTCAGGLSVAVFPLSSTDSSVNTSSRSRGLRRSSDISQPAAPTCLSDGRDQGRYARETTYATVTYLQYAPQASQQRRRTREQTPSRVLLSATPPVHSLTARTLCWVSRPRPPCRGEHSTEGSHCPKSPQRGAPSPAVDAPHDGIIKVHEACRLACQPFKLLRPLLAHGREGGFELGPCFLHVRRHIEQHMLTTR